MHHPTCTTRCPNTRVEDLCASVCVCVMPCVCTNSWTQCCSCVSLACAPCVCTPCVPAQHMHVINTCPPDVSAPHLSHSTHVSLSCASHGASPSLQPKPAPISPRFWGRICGEERNCFLVTIWKRTEGLWGLAAKGERGSLCVGGLCVGAAVRGRAGELTSPFW